jgi:uncharacterized pyridoxamine 5'-phosphate oxidase family protein
MRFDHPEVRQFLDRSMILRLAALSPKGLPNVRCLWFVCWHGRIYIFTGETTPTSRGIAVHPDVSLLFDGERDPRSGRLLRVRGRAVFRTESGITARVMLALARKYFLTPAGLWNMATHAGRIPATVRFYVEGRADVRKKIGRGPAMILEVQPESFELLPRNPAQPASVPGGGTSPTKS